MSSENFSLIIRCWHELQTDAIQLRLTLVDTGEDVRVRNGGFNLHISIDEHNVTRCHIQPIASGSEAYIQDCGSGAYIQGGPNLRTFVKACLLDDGEAGIATPNSPEP